MFTMKTRSLVFLMGTLLHCVTSMTHTLMEFQTASSQMPNLPEFLMVGVVNGLQVSQYDSVTRREVPTVDWMDKVTEEDPHFWKRETERDKSDEEMQRSYIEVARLRLNKTEGPHIWQLMYGCEWDDETDVIRGFSQYAFDGEDFISLDWDTGTYVAAKPQAFSTKLKWERTGVAEHMKHRLTYVCAEWLKKFVRFGAKTLLRKELPRVSFLQKSSSSPVTCHATGFYPDRAMLFWAKDGEELLEEDPGEILPNHDGTFQSSVSLDLSSVPTADWGRYSCVFQLSGVKDDLITKLDPKLIRTNEKKPNTSIIIAVVLSAFGLAVLAFGIILYRKFHNNNTI